MRTLVVTVGGSPEPIRTAIESLEPDRVVFLCSGGKFGSRPQVDGEGTPCEVRRDGEVVEKRPSLVRQLDLQDFQVEVVEDPDDVAGWYSMVRRVLDRLLDEDGAEVLVDYTGGTKTMSAALVTGALDRGVPLHLTSRARTNLVKVDFGQSTERLETGVIHAERALRVQLPEFLEAFDYPGAVRLLKELATRGHVRGPHRDEARLLQDVCRALEAWDRFDHGEALLYLEQEQQKRHSWVRDNLWLRATNLVAARAELEDRESTLRSQHHGYEPVWDLLLNADRRAVQGRYDDAVGRLYRALELLAQIRLRKAHGLRTAGVTPEALPESVRAEVMRDKNPEPKTGTVRLGLFDAWRVLAGFPGDPMGQRFVPLAGDLQQALEVRNYSLFAHGFQPITSDQWRRFHKTVAGFMTNALRDVVKQDLPPQLPGEMPDLVAVPG